MSVFTVAHTVVAESFDDEVIVVNLDRGNYYSLRGVAAWLWQGLTAGQSVSTLAEALPQHYVVTATDAAHALTAFVAQLQAQDLVISQTNPPALISALAPPLAERQPFVPPVLDVYTDMADLLALDPIHDVNPAIGWPMAK